VPPTPTRNSPGEEFVPTMPWRRYIVDPGWWRESTDSPLSIDGGDDIHDNNRETRDQEGQSDAPNTGEYPPLTLKMKHNVSHYEMTKHLSLSAIRDETPNAWVENNQTSLALRLPLRWNAKSWTTVLSTLHLSDDPSQQSFVEHDEKYRTELNYTSLWRNSSQSVVLSLLLNSNESRFRLFHLLPSQSLSQPETI
jgi:hypothetical protein